MKIIKSKVLWIALFSISVMTLGLFRICAVNQKYPSPQEICFHANEDCIVSDCRIRLLDMELLSGEEIKNIVSGMPLLYNTDGTPYPWEKQKLVLATLEIEGTGDQDTMLDLTEIVLETKAWGNGITGELFSVLNSENGSLYEKLAEGETQTIICPFLLADNQFTEKEWKNLNAEKFSLILSYYPEKIMLLK